MLDLFELHNIMPSFPSMHVNQLRCQIMWQSWDKWYCRYKIFSKGKEISLFLENKPILEVINNFSFPTILKKLSFYTVIVRWPVKYSYFCIEGPRNFDFVSRFGFLATRNNCCKPKFSQNRKNDVKFVCTPKSK